MTDIALGTIPFGTALDEAASFAILDRFAEAGGTVLDTANNYTFWVDGGTGDESETTIGRWLASRGARDRMVVSTKCGARPTLPGARTLDSAEGLSPSTVRAAVEGSLRRLGTDHVDVYWAHVEDHATPLEEQARVFGELVAEGKARHVGASNHPAWRIERARGLALSAGLTPYTHVQLRHSYLRPRPGVRLDESAHVQAGEETLGYVRAEGLRLWTYSTLLSGAYTRADRPIPAQYDHPGTTRRLAALREVAGEIGATPNQVVIAWLLAQDIVPIVGVSSLAQLDEMLGAREVKLDEHLLGRLDEPSLA
ncbi:oxidoreductase [Sphaerisporangium siamense]|uniref:Aryl-alcohol dehydrogenase-like predicted oxidoreductase n=1 Tax=Sphaerisporangium siamense TaxID=795645 RepID=A0A7W7GAF3_9ACTN|nr:aldo/keto reductase [Sphaerisporangium siamense]MBB4701364.1 aryl-alcohol dehydrogenase-like predicted oxidoreductase [Sphaerisporangium siamense]GII85488.1 oxidoreductase [Sphaerisporangium siamense]